MFSLIDIINSWATSFNPTSEEIEIAKHRAEICDGCPFKKEISSFLLLGLTKHDKILNKYKCSACGCPLSKKLFSYFKEACPENKWDK